MKRLLALVFLVLLLPQPAAAQDEWISYPCGSGTLRLESVTFEVVAPNTIRVEMPGSLACGAASKYRFAVATFVPGSTTAYVYEGMLGIYDPAGPTDFRVAVGLVKGQQLGMCLMPDPATRLSCVLVTADSVGAVSVTSLDTAGTGVIGEYTPTRALPECNACWQVV